MSAGTTPPILYLSEGDSESLHSWSGSSYRLVTALRDQGASVRTADVLPGKLGRYLAMGLAFRPSRRAWAAGFHLGAFGFAQRSRNARRAGAAQPGDAVLIQSGATFNGRLHGHRLYLYCDANVLIAERGRPWSQDSEMSADVLREVVERERGVYRQATRIFTMSEMARRSFIEDFGIDAARVSTVYAGSNLRTMPTDDEVTAPREGPPRIVFVGKAFRRKGGDDVLAAFRLVRAQIPDAQLVIAGGGYDGPGGDGVEVRGFVDPNGTGPGTLRDLYQGADVFCMPSRYEPFGIVFVEAMLHALPCVGARAWAMPELIDDGATGWLVDPGNVPDLARVLTAALRDRPRLRAMGMAGRRKALETFAWDKVAGRMIDHIRRDGGVESGRAAGELSYLNSRETGRDARPGG